MARTSELLTPTEVTWVEQGNLGDLRLLETTAPSTVTNTGQLYVKASDHLLYFKNASGAETPVISSGSGTVTSVSVATANGFSGTVANATTTPAITIIAGAITPTTVNGNTFTTGTYTLTGQAGKTLTFNGSITLTGTDAQTYTFPTTSSTLAALASPVFSGKPTINNFDNTGATYAPSSGSQTVALDCASNNMHIVTGNASGTAITFTITNATNNQPFIVSVLQGSGTLSTISGWFATVRWAGGSAPTLTATLNKRDTFGFIRTGSNTYDGFIIGQNC